MGWFLDTFAPETVDRRNRQRAMLEMGRGMAPNIQDPRLRGLLESDDIAKVQAGMGLLDEYRGQQLKQLVGQPSQTYTPGQGQGPLENRQATGLMGGLEKNDPNALRNFYAQLPAIGGDYAKLGIKALAETLPGNTNSPASVREFEFFDKLPVEKRAQFMGLKRQGYEIEKIGDVPHLVSRIPGIPPIPLSSLSTEVQGKSAVAAGQESAKTGAKLKTESQFSLGGTLDNLSKMRTNIDNLLASPGFDTIYGASSVIDPRNYVRGTDASDAQGKLSQLDAESFGISIQNMRGLGALSDAEGKKVSAAYTRATNPAISEEEARVAWGEVKGYLDMAEKRAKEKAGVTPQGNPQGNPQRKRVRVDAQGNPIP